MNALKILGVILCLCVFIGCVSKAEKDQSVTQTGKKLVVPPIPQTINKNIFALELNDYDITKEITIYGKITLKDNYGLPNYGENPESDTIETYYYILLQKPLKIKINGVITDITEMQIIFNSNVLKQFYAKKHIQYMATYFSQLRVITILKF